jgi:hypothetical protein
MTQTDLDRAYDLIKEGNVQAAVALLEPIIRNDRENGDAWWLLANATDDPATQQNALNNVLRIGGSTSRVHKARLMLQALEEQENPFEDLEPAPLEELSAPRQKFAAPRRKRSAWKVFLFAFLGMFLCICASCVGIVFAAGGSIDELVSLASVPENFTSQGMLELGGTINGEITSEDDYEGFIYRADGQEKLIIEIETVEDIPPFVLVYGQDGAMIPTGSINYAPSASGETTVSQSIITLPQAGEYAIVIRPLFSLGITSYEMTIR